MVWWLLGVTGPTMTPSMAVAFKWNYRSQGVAGNSSCRTWVPILLDSLFVQYMRFFSSQIHQVYKSQDKTQTCWQNNNRRYWVSA
jgi:hypothetical protein